MLDVAAPDHSGGLFGPIRIEEDRIRLDYANPRHSRALDIVMLTDLKGLVRDVGSPGLPSANAIRLGRSHDVAEGELTFWTEDAPEGFYVYSLSAGRYVRGGESPPHDDLLTYVSQVNADFLVRSKHAECAPFDALALGVPAEDVVAGLYQDILQRQGDEGGIANYSEAVLDGARELRQIAIDLAASGEMAERVMGKLPAPALSQFRSRVLYVPHFADRARPAGFAVDVEAAFKALDIVFDERCWDRAYYQGLLEKADGDIAAFAKDAAPLPLVSL